MLWACYSKKGSAGFGSLTVNSESNVLQVWVLDSPLGETNGLNGKASDTDQVINEILGIPLPVPSREWLYEYMTERGYSTAIQQWLGSNLVGTRGGFRWAFNISGNHTPYAPCRSFLR